MHQIKVKDEKFTITQNYEASGVKFLKCLVYMLSSIWLIMTFIILHHSAKYTEVGEDEDLPLGKEFQDFVKELDL